MISQRARPALWRRGDRAGTDFGRPAVPTTVFGNAFLVLRLESGPALALESTLQLTKAVRDAFLSLCPIQPPPEWLSGHAPNGVPSQAPHAALFPLPDVDAFHADGRIVGVGIAVPRAVTQAERGRCLGDILFDRLGRTRSVRVTMGRLGAWEIALTDNQGRPMALHEETWTSMNSAEERWATVTPIAFDRHPNLCAGERASLASLPDTQRKARERVLLAEQAGAMVKQACRRIGLPAPSEVELAPVSCHAGTPHAGRFPCIERKAGGSLRHAHAVLIFPVPVAGPMLLGAGRYRGYGLCRPLRHGGGS